MTRVLNRRPARQSAGVQHSLAITLLWLLRVGLAGTLVVDAYTHAVDARYYNYIGTSITQGDLFRVEAVAAGLAAAAVLTWHTRASWLIALAVAASAFAAVVTYRYVNVGAVGPLPDMYEPTWAVPGKLLSAYAEAIATAIALGGYTIAPNANSPRGISEARRPGDNAR